jgi:hypothetical protein
MVTGQDQTPLSRVPDAGAVELQLALWTKSGAVKVHVALDTPDRSSVNVMLHVTVCEASVVSIVGGEKLNAVSTGAAESHWARAGDHAAATRTRKATESTRSEGLLDMAEFLRTNQYRKYPLTRAAAPLA